MLSAKAIHAAVWDQLQRRRQSGCTKQSLGLQVRQRDALPIGSLIFIPDRVLHVEHMDHYVPWEWVDRHLMHEPIFIDLDVSLVLLHHQNSKQNDIEVVSYDSLELNLCTSLVSEIEGIDQHHLSMDHDYSDEYDVNEQYVIEIQGMGNMLLDTLAKHAHVTGAKQAPERMVGKSPLLAAPYGATKPPFGF